jgi:hypothetical protein
LRLETPSNARLSFDDNNLSFTTTGATKPHMACPQPACWLFAAQQTLFPDPEMFSPLTKAADYRAYAAASLANAEADKKNRNVHMAIARHFYSLAEDEIGRVSGVKATRSA